VSHTHVEPWRERVSVANQDNCNVEMVLVAVSVLEL